MELTNLLETRISALTKMDSKIINNIKIFRLRRFSLKNVDKSFNQSDINAPPFKIR